MKLPQFKHQDWNKYPDRNLCGYFALNHFLGGNYKMEDFIVEAGRVFQQVMKEIGVSMSESQAREDVQDANDPGTIVRLLNVKVPGCRFFEVNAIPAPPAFDAYERIIIAKSGHFICVIKHDTGVWHNFDSLQGSHSVIGDNSALRAFIVTTLRGIGAGFGIYAK